MSKRDDENETRNASSEGEETCEFTCCDCNETYTGDRQGYHNFDRCIGCEARLIDIGLSLKDEQNPVMIGVNCRLIAKAPELLAALKGLSDSIDMEQEFEHQLDCEDPESCTLCIARKAISEVEHR